MRSPLIWSTVVAAALFAGLGYFLGASPTPAGLAPQSTDPYVGSRMCLRCHQGVAEDLGATPHGSDDFHTLAERGCEDCHGPARAHVQDPENPDLRPRFAALDVEVQRTGCLACHSSALPGHDAAHAEYGVSCADCHSVHDWQAGATTAGNSACFECHAEVRPASRAVRTSQAPAGPFFESAPHVLADIACTACHELGDAESQVPTGLEADELCQTCHQKDHRRFERSPHADLGCTGCHSVHGETHYGPHSGTGVPAEFFRTASITGTSATCAGCHQDVAASFQFNERHRLQEGIVECTSCHDPHEPSQRLRLGGFKQEECVACHADKGGPFVFEHGPQRVDGCVACHDPHSSPNRQMLHFERVGDLCYSCHGRVPGFHLNFSPDRDCTECHQAIHGSHVDRAFFR